MLVTVLIVVLFLVVGGLLVYGAVAYRSQVVEHGVLWTGIAGLLLAVLFAYIRK